MNYKLMGRVIALILSVEAVFLLPPLAISLYDGNRVAAQSFGGTICIVLLLVAALFFLTRRAKHVFYAKEGLVCVGLCWILLSLIGCLPFYFSQEIPRFIDAFLKLYPVLPPPALRSCRMWRS